MEKVGQLVLRKYTSSNVYNLDGELIELDITDKQKQHSDWKQKLELHFGRRIKLDKTIEWGNETFYNILTY